jgi:hypothetical protein
MNNYKIKEMLVVGFRKNSTLMSTSTPFLAVFEFGFLRNKLRKCPVKLVFRALNSFCHDLGSVLHGRP